MGKKKLTPQLKGMVARIIAKISVEDKVSINDAFEIYAGDLSRNMKKYDVRTIKGEIVALAGNKVSSASKPKPPAKKGRGRKAKPKPKPSTNMITLKDGRTGTLRDPKMVKVKGTAKLKKTEVGTIVEATSKTKKLLIKCDDESEGVKISETEAGCFVEDQGYEEFED